MNRDDIIRMALEAGCEIRNGHAYLPHSLDQMLKRFAALVAAAERQRCADIANQHASIEGIAQKIAAEIRGLK